MNERMDGTGVWVQVMWCVRGNKRRARIFRSKQKHVDNVYNKPQRQKSTNKQINNYTKITQNTLMRRSILGWSWLKCSKCFVLMIVCVCECVIDERTLRHWNGFSYAYIIIIITAYTYYICMHLLMVKILCYIYGVGLCRSQAFDHICDTFERARVSAHNPLKHDDILTEV